MSVSRSHSLKAGAPYALRSLTDKPQIIEVHHAPGAIDYILLPTDAFQRFQFLPLEHEVVIRAERLEARKARISLWNRNTPERIVRKSRFAAPLRYGGCIYSFDRPQKGDPKLSLADNRGMDLGSESLATLLSSQMIRDSIPKLPHGDAPAPQIDGAIAIILHLHYPHLWEEFATFFKHSKLSFQLIVTLTATNSDLEAKITSEFPGAIVRVVENLGRDVRPFIKMLQSVALENVDFICKLHGKRSILSGVSGARFGHLWRRRALLDLLGSPLQVQKILSRFQTRPQLGMIGPATLRLRNGSGSDPGFDSSLPIRRNLCAKAQMGAVNIEEDFFAGTMFWVRKDALAHMKTLTLDREVFTDESAQLGDQFEHGLERFFADCVRARGYTLADIEPLALAEPDIPLRCESGRLLAPRAMFQAPRHFYRSRWAKPLPIKLEGQRVALLSSQKKLETFNAEGYLTCICLATAFPDSTYDGPAEAAFLSDTGGFEMALWSCALQSSPQLWDAEELKLVSDKDVFTLPRKALTAPQVRELFEDVLAWNKEGETEHRHRLPLRSILARI